MEELKNAIEEISKEKIIKVVISNKINKETKYNKIVFLLKESKNKEYYQIEKYTDKQVFHENIDLDLFKSKFEESIAIGYKQVSAWSDSVTYDLRISKKGKVHLGKKMDDNDNIAKKSHNKKKNYILQEGMIIEPLIDLGVFTKEGKVINSKYDKYKQINRFVEIIDDEIKKNDYKELTILDFGCGKSYLTFAMYYYLHELKGYDIRIIGLDLKTDVILHCNELAKKYGYEKLTFLVGDIADYEGVDQVDMVVTLHACDTATDYALAKAVGWNAKVILSVPCCQHEVNKQLEKQRNLHSGKMKSKTEVMEVSEMLGDQLASMEEVLGPIMDYGLLRERFAALVTDGLRAKRLESEGYETQVLEFIDMEHTPKNILLRAVKKGSPAAKSRKEAEDCERFLKIQPTLGMLLAEQKGDK